MYARVEGQCLEYLGYITGSMVKTRKIPRSIGGLKIRKSPGRFERSKRFNWFGSLGGLKVAFFRKFDWAQKNMPNHYPKLEFLK